MSTTLYDKIWNDHLVDQQDDGTALLFVDRHLVHEVTSPQAFEGLRNSNRKVRHPNLTLAVADHNVPTTDRTKGIADAESKIQVDTLEANCKEFGVQLFGMDDKRQGIVHIIGPEQGFTQPGTVIVCGDSHTATHGAFGALAFGIGTSEVEHVLATQTLVQQKAKNFRINVNGQLPLGVTSKDVILQIIGKIGTAGGTGSVIEYAGDLIRSLSVEQRMTICNMTIEGGARAGLIAPDDKIFNYLKGKPMSPKGDNWEKALNYWNTLKTDADANFDQELNLNADEILPMITWGTSPQDVITIDGKVPNPQSESDEDKKNSIERALKYMKGGYGSLVGMDVGTKENGAKFIDNLKMLYHVANIGDARSLAIHPATTTHSQLNDQELLAAGVTPGYVRLSVGIEHPDDIIADIKQALAA